LVDSSVVSRPECADAPFGADALLAEANRPARGGTASSVFRVPGSAVLLPPGSWFPVSLFFFPRVPGSQFRCSSSPVFQVPSSAFPFHGFQVPGSAVFFFTGYRLRAPGYPASPGATQGCVGYRFFPTAVRPPGRIPVGRPGGPTAGGACLGRSGGGPCRPIGAWLPRRSGRTACRRCRPGFAGPRART